MGVKADAAPAPFRMPGLVIDRGARYEVDYARKCEGGPGGLSLAYQETRGS